MLVEMLAQVGTQREIGPSDMKGTLVRLRENHDIKLIAFTVGHK